MSSAQPTHNRKMQKTATATITYSSNACVCVSLRSRWPSYSDQQSKFTKNTPPCRDCTKKDDRKHEIRMICMNKMDLIIQFASLILNCKFFCGGKRAEAKNNSQRLNFGWHRFTQLFFSFFVLNAQKWNGFRCVIFFQKSLLLSRFYFFSFSFYFIKTPQAKRKLSKKRQDFNKRNKNTKNGVRKTHFNAFRMVKQLVLLDCTRFI